MSSQTSSQVSSQTIRVLPQHISRLIAAGEVVARPLDVLRELIDNALDAQASRIEIAIERGGLACIEVKDNGQGIAADQLQNAAIRHATSKLPWRPDALEHVHTLGFRGEALWAIAQAGQLELTSRPVEQLGAARLKAFAEQCEVSKVSAAAGTRVIVRDLFAHLPARLHTQLAPATELREMIALLGRYVLHYPRLHWRLSSATEQGNPHELKLSHAPSDTRGAVASIYGSLNANRMLALDHPAAQEAAPKQDTQQQDRQKNIRLTGAISRPELSRSRRDRMHVAVNGRPVLPPPALEKAIVAAYSELLPVGHAPLCVLNVHLPAEQHNPNVHPHKQTVAFHELAELCHEVSAAIREQLARQPLAPMAPVPVVTGPVVSHSDHAPESEPPEPEPPETHAQQHTQQHNTQQHTQQHFPRLTLLNVFQSLYLLAEAEGDLWLVDGHAAHERIWYERLEQKWQGVSYELPTPELLQLTPLQQSRLTERQTLLQELGLTLEEFGTGLARLRALPAVLAHLPVPRLYEQLRDDLLTDSDDPQRVVLARLACAPALKAGMFDADNAATILEELSRCRQPWACPHGRPTTLRLSERELAHAFGRRGVRDVARGRDA